MIIDKEKLIAAIRAETPGNLYAHAVRELPDAGDDKMQACMNECLLQMVLVFSSQGHSGFSSGYAIAALTKLLDFQPLRPLTGEDSEWNEVGTDVWQNNRCSHVFKDADGRAYDIQGRVFREPNGSGYTSGKSRVYIEFPYTPKIEYVDVDADGKEIAK
jgi:hypothetical protein